MVREHVPECLPDVKGRIEHIISEGDMVAVAVVFEGTQQGDFFGIPATGRRMSQPGVDILKVEDGKLAHSWANFDVAGMMRQLGALQGPSSEQDETPIDAPQPAS